MKTPLIATLALILGLANAASAATTQVADVAPSNNILFGVFVNNHDHQTAPHSQLAQLSALESQIGRHAALTLHFRGWTTNFPGADEAQDFANGRTPIESWNCGDSNANVAAGHDDALIKSRADALKAYGHPIFLRYMWEMNLPKKANGRNACYDSSTDDRDRFSPTQFVAAWNHIHTIFAQEGASNVIFFWCPSGQNDPMAYYPGASTVDWAGFDFYDRHGESVAQAYSHIYSLEANLGKPMMVGETGAQPGTQPAFFQSMASTLRTQFPLIKGFVYFDSPGKVGGWNIQDFDDFGKMAKDPYFAGKLDMANAP